MWNSVVVFKPFFWEERIQTSLLSRLEVRVYTVLTAVINLATTNKYPASTRKKQ